MITYFGLTGNFNKVYMKICMIEITVIWFHLAASCSTVLPFYPDAFTSTIISMAEVCLLSVETV
jgi:hypothetical protein